jgi:hypothetical protein
MYPVLGLMKKMHAAKTLTPEADAFMADHRPPEELYDLTTDPYEVHNIAAKPEVQSELEKLRNTLAGWISQTHDQGAIAELPESSRS